MNDQELKSLWQRQELAAPNVGRDVELIARMKKKMRKFDRQIFWRDVREFIAAAFVIYSYYGMSLKCHSLLGLAGCWVVMLSSVFIAGEIFYTRHKQKPVSGAAPVREFVAAESRKVGTQIRLLESVLWWYILPIMIGAEMYALGETRDLADKIAVSLVFIFVGAVVWWVNRYAAKKSLRPLQMELQKALDATPEFSESNSTNQ